MPGLFSGGVTGCVGLFDAHFWTCHIDANPAIYNGLGPNNDPPLANPLFGCWGSHGHCPASEIATIPGSRLHAWVATSPDDTVGDATLVSAFSYPFGCGSIFYSQIPESAWFWYESDIGDFEYHNFRLWHANAISAFTNGAAFDGAHSQGVRPTR